MKAMRSVGGVAAALAMWCGAVAHAAEGGSNNLGGPDKKGEGLSNGAANYFVYFGTYTGGKSKGIYLSRMNPADGALSAPELVAEARNPSFLAAHPNGKYLYAVSEIGGGGGADGGVVLAYRIEGGSGKLQLLNRQGSGGDGPCHLAVDPSGRCLVVANYGSGSVSVLPVAADGPLGTPASFVQHYGSSVNPGRQKEPHAHCVTLDPEGRLAFVADLGLDKILAYRLNAAQAELELKPEISLSVKPGAGPRHCAFHPNGKFFYVINELDSTVAAFERSGRRSLKPLQTLSTLPADFRGSSTTAEVEVDASGRFLYGSNRGHDSIALFEIDSRSGKLRWVEAFACGGRTPRHFKIDPTGKFLFAALQDSDAVVRFTRDTANGRLTPTDGRTEIGAPVCVVFVPAF